MIARTLDALIRIHPRAAGHTAAAIKVAKEVNGILVLNNQQQKSYVEHMAKNLNAWPIHLMTLDEVTNNMMVGRPQPVIIDHYALENLFRAMRVELDGLNRTISDLRAALERERIAHARIEEPEPAKRKRKKRAA